MRYALIVLFVLAGCSTSQEELAGKTAPVVRQYEASYQEIYRRIVNSGKRCLAASMSAYSSMEVDSELYPDLGYGEVSLSLVNFGTRNYYWTAKIEEADSGSRLTMNAGNTVGAPKLIASGLRWADGDPSCGS